MKNGLKIAIRHIFQPIAMYFFLITLCSDLILAETQTNHTSQNPSVSRVLSFSSGYFDQIFNSNEGLTYFPISAIQFWGYAFDKIIHGPEHTPFKRIALVAIGIPVAYWYTHSVFIPFHEFGHYQALRSFGATPQYLSYGYGITARSTSFWGIQAYRILTPPLPFPGSGTAETVGNLPSSLNIPANLLTHYGGRSGVEIIAAASGLNNQMLLSRKIAEIIQKGQGHFTNLQHYFGNKISGWILANFSEDPDPTNDPRINGVNEINEIIRQYRNKGYTISRGDLKAQSLLSNLSGSTVAMILGYLNYIKTGNPKVDPLELSGFRVPDLNAYINAKGLSFEVVTGYRLNSDWRFDLAFETIWKGERLHQITPGVRFQLASLLPYLNDFWISTDLVISAGVGGSLSAEWQPHLTQNNLVERLSYFTRIIIYSAYTLYGERNITSLQGKDHSFDWIVGLNYHY